MALVTSPSETPSDTSAMPDLMGEEDGERVSVTDVHGTIARFEMAYTPASGERFAFGPPLRTRLPSLLYLVVAVLAAAVVAVAYASSSGSALFRWVVEGDKHRVLSSPGFVLILVASAIGTAVRAQMRGVVVSDEGLEMRTLLAFGFPRVRRWAWPQIDRIIVDEAHDVMVELWNGAYERLPPVAEGKKLTQLLEQIALGRRMQVTRLARLGR
jgi:hypothetical protein